MDVNLTGQIPTFLIGLFTALTGILVWVLNEWSKRSSQEYRRKEERYGKLIEGISVKSQKEFKKDLNLCWLYCPDDVVRIATDYYVALENGTKEKKEAVAGELIYAIRKDALKMETTLTPEYYRDKPNRLVPLSGEAITQTGMKGDMQNKKKAGGSSGNDTGGLEGMEDDPKAYYTRKRDWRAIILRFVLLMCSIALLVYWLLRIGLLHPS